VRATLDRHRSELDRLFAPAGLGEIVDSPRLPRLRWMLFALCLTAEGLRLELPEPSGAPLAVA